MIVATNDPLMSKTRAELSDQAIMAAGQFIERAVKADMVELIHWLQGDAPAEETAAPVPTEVIRLIDRSKSVTMLDLVSGSLVSRAMMQTYEGAVVVEGTGPIMDLDLSTMVLFAQDVIEWDPPPTNPNARIHIRFHDPDSDEPPVAEEAADDEEETPEVAPEEAPAVEESPAEVPAEEAVT